MPLDVVSTQAQVVLGLIPTERMSTIAQDAMEAGFDGPAVVRMAILEPGAGWAIDQALLAELDCSPVTQEEAAIHLATERAKRILEFGEDPIPALPYFYRLMLASGYAGRLVELGFLEDDYEFRTAENLDERRTRAREVLKDLPSP